MNRTLVILAVAAAAATLVDDTAAQRGGRGAPADVWGFLADKYDADKNGKITPAEYGRGVDKFGGYDRDGDGQITKDDFSGGNSRRRGGRRRTATNTVSASLSRLLAKNSDTNEDGEVTQGEWRKVLATLDGDQDSIISPKELSGIMCAALGGRTLSLRAVQRRSRHIDANKDGKVQLAEMSGMFGKLDKNGDKVISKAELGSTRPTRSGPPRVGEAAPDFNLPLVADKKTLVRLSRFKGKKPVALIFGSYT
jgi:Ca2+-binding EF-hand superfamily protein